MLKEVQPEDISERRAIELQADSLFETVAYMAKAVLFISDDQVPEEVWEDLASTCYRCAACTNLCPVCTCYTVDERQEADGSFTRCRSWDSCQFAGFTRESQRPQP